MLTGRRYDAEEGAAAGLSQYVVDDGAGLTTALELADRIAGNAPQTNYAIVQALPRIAEADPGQGFLMESMMAAIAQGTTTPSSGCRTSSTPRDEGDRPVSAPGSPAASRPVVRPGDVVWTRPRRASRPPGWAGSWLAADQGHDVADRAALWRWSVADLDGFWAAVWDHFGVVDHGTRTAVLADRSMPGAVWFPDPVSTTPSRPCAATVSRATHLPCSAARSRAPTWT